MTAMVIDVEPVTLLPALVKPLGQLAVRAPVLPAPGQPQALER